MISPKDVRPIPQGLLEIGIPLRHPIYDKHGNLLMQIGTTIESEKQLENLYLRGLYMDIKETDFFYEKTEKEKSIKAPNSEKKISHQNQAETLVDFSSGHIKIGDIIQINPLSNDFGQVKFSVKYLGGLDKKSIICTLPELDEKIVYIKENSGLAAVAFSGKNIYKFSTVVEATFTRPYPHMHLKFPLNVYGNQIRKNQRINTNIIVSLLNLSAGENHQAKTAGRMVDLSLGGAMIESSKPAGIVGDQLECAFKISMDGGEAVFALNTTLRNVNDITSEQIKPMFKQGISFEHLNFQDKAVLQSYIYKLLTGQKLDEL